MGNLDYIGSLMTPIPVGEPSEGILDDLLCLRTDWRNEA